ncbi:MAG: hypothetical protein GY711_08170 [bacterium]|nr:hypothetical protein [bacterium]
MHDSVLRGGDGGTALGHAYLDEGGHGGDGIHGMDTAAIPLFLNLSGTTAQGGIGGDGELCICSGGNGGDGVQLSGPTAQLSALDSFFGGGPEGCGSGNPVPGVPLRLENGAASTTLPGDGRTLIGPNVVREGALRSLVILGQPGDLVVLSSATTAGFELRPMWSGVLLLGTPSLQSMRVLGVVPATGTLIQNLVAPELLVGVDSLVLYHQALLRDTAGAGWLTGSWTELLLDSSF